MHPSAPPLTCECLQFVQLQQDYEYNLELLDARDAELEKYDTDFEALKQELSGRDQLVAQLRSSLAHAHSGKSSIDDVNCQHNITTAPQSDTLMLCMSAWP